MADETEEKVLIAFKCSPEMKEFILQQAGEETVSTYLRALVKKEMVEINSTPVQ